MSTDLTLVGCKVTQTREDSLLVRLHRITQPTPVGEETIN